MAGATVTLYAVGNTGYGAGATVLDATASATGGNYTVNYTCPSSSVLTYVAATGGSVKGLSNPAIGLIAAIGPCGNIRSTASINLNERTTVGTEWALTQFIDASGEIIGSSATNAAGLALAYKSYYNLVAVEVSRGYSISGGPSRFLPAADACSTNPVENCNSLERSDTLADIIAACAGGAGPNSTACSELFADTGTSGNTLAAAYAMAANPSSNVKALFDIQALLATRPYQPTLAAAPDGFEIALALGANEALGLAIDGAGNVFNAAGSVVFELTAANSYRTILKLRPSTAGLFEDFFVALDTAGNIFATDHADTGVSELTKVSNYSAGSLFQPSGLNAPYGIALDISDNLFVLDSSGAISELTASSGYATAANLVDSNTDYVPSEPPVLDAAGDIFVPNAAPLGHVTSGVSIFTNASNYATVLHEPCAGCASQSITAVALDAGGNLFGQTDNSVVEFTAASEYAGVLSFAPVGAGLTGGYAFTTTIALDSAANVFATNASGNLSELTAASGYQRGLSLTAASNQNLGSIVLDAAGNVWVGGSSSAIEFLGLAHPVLTPLQACLKRGHAVCAP